MMNQIAKVQTNTELTSFEQMQREAKLFATSPLVPDHLRKGSAEQALANCYIALTIAKAMGENPLVVMQNIYIVHGKAGWSSQYMIARANASGVFKGRINWRIEGKGESLSVIAFATLSESGEVVEATASMAMAKAEGWLSNSKYKTMPDVMLRYRSAAFLVRFYCPEVMLGYQTYEEILDVRAAEAKPVKQISKKDIFEQAEIEPEETASGDDVSIDADIVEDAVFEDSIEENEDEISSDVMEIGPLNDKVIEIGLMAISKAETTASLNYLRGEYMPRAEATSPEVVKKFEAAYERRYRQLAGK